MTNPPNIEGFSGSDSSFNIPTYVTLPDGNKYHWIEDKHLEVIMKINAPISAGISLTCLGYVLGEVRDILLLKNSTSFTSTDMILVALFAGSLMAFIATGLYALCSKSEAKTILKEIRARTPQAWQNPNEPQRSA